MYDKCERSVKYFTYLYKTLSDAQMQEQDNAFIARPKLPRPWFCVCAILSVFYDSVLRLTDISYLSTIYHIKNMHELCYPLYLSKINVSLADQVED